jgi:hypothetical protein
MPNLITFKFRKIKMKKIIITKKLRLISAACAVAFSFISMSSHAAIVSYGDRAAWQSAAGGGVGDIFDNLNTGSGAGGLIDRGTYSSTGTAQNAFPNGNATTTIDGTGYIRYLLEPSTDGTLTFDAPVMALGFDINPWCNGGNCSFSNSLGASVSVAYDGFSSIDSVYLLPVSDVSGFRGFISDTPFTTFTITTSDPNAWHGVDNLEAFSASVVPLPAAVWLFGSGLGLLGWFRKRSI